MKIRLLYFVSVSMLLASCQDYLDLTPLDSIVDETYWNSEEQLRMAADAIYARIDNKTTVDMEQMADNTLWYNLNLWSRIGSGLHTTDLSTLNGVWTNNYRAIRECNAFLENYQQASEVVPGNNLKIASEVKVLRAYFFNNLINFFGDVPLVTQQLAIEDIYGPRDSRELIVDFILADLDEAAAALDPGIATGPALGRITKGAALALKARIALYNERFEEAERAAKEVMDLDVYSLYTNGDPNDSYRDLFSHNGKLARGNNQETIFARLNLEGVQMHNMSREVQVPENCRWNGTKSLAEAYLCIDGLPIHLSPLYNEDSYEDVFENRDPRMAQTLLKPGSVWGGLEDGNPENTDPTIYTSPKFRADLRGSRTITGYYFTKYVELSQVPMVGRDDNDFHLIRLAEVFLTYAEAKMELGSLTQSDLDISINLLRDRVGMKHMTLAEMASNGLDLREEIRRERRIELALEGQRYFDILRWGEGYRLGEDMKGVKKAWVMVQEDVANLPEDGEGYIIAQSNRNFDEGKHNLWPVPQVQRDLNPELGQNPGW